MKLSELLKAYRKKNTLSQQSLADKIGVSKQYISLLEKGENTQSGKPISPSISIIKKVSEVLQIPITTLLNQLDTHEFVSLPRTCMYETSTYNTTNTLLEQCQVDIKESSSTYDISNTSTQQEQLQTKGEHLLDLLNDIRDEDIDLICSLIERLKNSKL
jgi:hypothetical protein